MKGRLYNLEAQSWCLEKGYKIYKAITKETYTKKEVSDEIWKLYTKLHNKWLEQNKTQHT